MGKTKFGTKIVFFFVILLVQGQCYMRKTAWNSSQHMQ